MEKKKEAEYIFAKRLLDDLEPKDWSEETYNRLKDTYLQGKVSYKTWKRYIKENPRERPESLREQVLSLFAKKQFGEATELIVKKVLQKNYIYTTKEDKASEMWIYSEGIYIPNGESCVKEQIRQIMKDNYSEWLANQVLAKIKVDTYIESSEFFKDEMTYEIPVENGILDVLNIELRPFTPERIFFSKFPVKYIEGQTCKKIDEFLNDVLSSSEDKQVFYEIAGFGLIKEYTLEKAFMFVGNGRNGKGKSIELLKRLVGVNNTSSVPLSAITSDSPFVQNLWRRHFNLAGDISSKDLKETAMFKQLTGRDPISANRKYKNIIEFTNYAKLVFACNELPRVYDYSDGFWERWVLLEFPYKFVDKDIYEKAEDKTNLKIKDPSIIKKIATENEMSGLLNMAILGLHRILKNKRFSYTKGTSEVKNKWIRMADSFMAFCMDCLEEDYEGFVSKKQLRKKYKDYCSDHKVGGISDKGIKATLQERFGVSEEYVSVAGLGTQEWQWSGIKLKEKGGKY